MTRTAVNPACLRGSTVHAADLLGIAMAASKRVAAELALEPEAWVDNPDTPAGPAILVWALADVERRRAVISIQGFRQSAPTQPVALFVRSSIPRS